MDVARVSVPPQAHISQRTWAPAMLLPRGQAVSLINVFRVHRSLAKETSLGPIIFCLVISPQPLSPVNHTSEMFNVP